MNSLPAFAIASLLLSSGSLHAVTLWTTTFTGTVNTSGDASRTVVNTPAGTFTDTLSGTTSALTRSSATGNFFLTGSNNNFNNYNPNQNVDNAAGASWNSIFNFGPGLQTIELTDVTFNVYRFNSSGGIQAFDTVVRNVNISAEYTINGGANWIALAPTVLVDLTASNTTTPNIVLNFALSSPVTVDMATNDFQIRYTAANNNTNAGAFNGISSMVFNGSVVPEPSVALLGLFGGLGLLLRRRA